MDDYISDEYVDVDSFTGGSLDQLKFDGDKWVCPFCGYDCFTQSVIAENYVVLWTKGKVLVESDDYQGSWQGIDRGNIRCGRCYRELDAPDGALE